MTLPDPQLFSSWEAWARELAQQLNREPLAQQMARILVPADQMAFAYNRKLGTITLTAETALADGLYGDVSVSGGGLTMTVVPNAVDASEVDNLNDFIFTEVDGMLVAGSGVTLTSGGGNITIDSSGSGIAVKDEGSSITAAAGFLDFVGTGVTATTVSGGVQVSVPGASGGGSVDGRTHVVPTATDFSWVNQGSATVTQKSYGIILQQPSINGVSIAALVHSTPSTPYTITARIRVMLRANSGAAAGLIWRNSSDSKLQVIRRYYGSTIHDQRLTNYSGPTSPVSEQASTMYFSHPHEWYRLSDDGTNRKVEVSADGDVWATFWSDVRTSYLTPDQVGIYMENNQASTTRPAGMILLLSWEVA